jgi:hypothetical protein
VREHLHTEVGRDDGGGRLAHRHQRRERRVAQELADDLRGKVLPAGRLDPDLRRQPGRPGGRGDEFLYGRDVALGTVLGVEPAQPPDQVDRAGHTVRLGPVPLQPRRTGELRRGHEQVVQVGEVVVDDAGREPAGTGDGPRRRARVPQARERPYGGTQDALPRLGPGHLRRPAAA